MKSITVDDKLFNELRDGAIEIWSNYDDTYGYASEKINKVKSLSNVGDNWGTFIGMFDIHNQRKLYDRVSKGGQVLIDAWVGGSLAKLEQDAKSMGLFS
jgi:hypothetical protein